MGISSFFAGLRRAVVSASKDGAFVGPTKSGQRVDEATALGLSALWCGLRTISQDVGCLHPCVYQSGKKGVPSPEPTHALHKIFKSPNPEMTGITFRETMELHCLLYGNGYAEIQRRGDGSPAYVWPLHPDFVQPYRVPETGQLIYRYTREQTGGSPGPIGEQVEIEPQNMLHIPGLTPDGSVGYKLLKIARETIGFGLATQAYGAALYRTGCRPSGALKHPGKLSDNARENLRNSVLKLNGGAENAGSLLMLEEGVDWQQFQFSNDQLQYSTLLNWFVYEVARFLVMPPSKLMSLEKATWGNLTELNRDYLNTTLRPWLEKTEAEYERKLLLPSEQDTHYIEFDTSTLLRADQSTRYAAYDLALGHKAWRTINEIRAEENLPPLPGGDELAEPQPAPVQAEPGQDQAEPDADEMGGGAKVQGLAQTDQGKETEDE